MWGTTSLLNHEFVESCYENIQHPAVPKQLKEKKESLFSFHFESQ